MGFNINNNYGPLIDNHGGVVNLYQEKESRWKVDADDAVVVEENDSKVKEKAAVLTSNEEFMTIMGKAVGQELCSKEGWQYKWKEKIDAVYFASEASHKFHVSNRHDPDGGLAISWKPFEALFGEKGFRSKFNDYQQGKIKLRHKEEIDKLLR